MAKSFSKIALAGLAGLAAGIAIGVLMAPDKGIKTRKRLKKKLKKIEENFQLGDLSETINNLKSIFTKNKEDKARYEPPSNDKD
jgi:gas vesicle protein